MGIDEIRLIDMHFRMDWRSVKFDWNQARAFLVTAENGSLSTAARELGVVLFKCVGRRLALTQSGLELVEHVRAAGDAATRMSLTAPGQVQSIEGSV